MRNTEYVLTDSRIPIYKILIEFVAFNPQLN
jgi:hypothetical protein